jgi:hypothetical protein
MNNKQEISAGNHSNNIQASKVIVNQYNLTYSEVKEVAMDVFKSNFYDLGTKVEKIVNERAEEIINKYIRQLQATAPEAITNTEDPDMRFAIYEVQKNHVRRGDKEIADLLVDMLVNRTKVKDQPFVKLVANEALEIIPKLTLKQIDILTLIFIGRGYIAFGNLVPIDEYLKVLKIFADNIPTDQIFYQHLQYTGCISISIGSAQFESIVPIVYPGLFTNGQDGNQVKSTLAQINPEFTSILENWNKTKLCNSELTSVGIAIALSNLNRKIGSDFNLDIWIKG